MNTYFIRLDEQTPGRKRTSFHKLVVVAPDQDAAIAIAMRKALCDPQKTCAGEVAQIGDNCGNVIARG